MNLEEYFKRLQRFAEQQKNKQNNANDSKDPARGYDGPLS